jgi:FkbM family methyltransferase
MRRLLKRLIADGPLEQICRYADRSVSGVLQRFRKLVRSASIHDKYDIQTVQLMSELLLPDSCCVDIGCHKGEMLEEMLKHAPKGHHFAFEPLPGFFAGLKETFATSPNVRLYHCALSDRIGTTTFQHVVSNPAYSGILKRTYARENEVIQEITVELKRLDDVIPADLDIGFIKIDVEGAELQVLLGGVETVRRCQPTIVFEHGLGAADHYGTKPEQVFELLVDQCGLEIHLMDSWLNNRTELPLSLKEFQEQFWSGKNYYFMATAAIRKSR